MQTKLFLALAAISLWSGTILISAGSNIYGQTTAGNEPGIESGVEPGVEPSANMSGANEPGIEPGVEPGVETSSNVSSSYSK